MDGSKDFRGDDDALREEHSQAVRLAGALARLVMEKARRRAGRVARPSSSGVTQALAQLRLLAGELEHPSLSSADRLELEAQIVHATHKAQAALAIRAAALSASVRAGVPGSQSPRPAA